MKKKDKDDTHAGVCYLCGKHSLELHYRQIVEKNRLIVVSLCPDCQTKAP